MRFIKSDRNYAAWSASVVLSVLAVAPRASADYPIVSHRYLADPGVLVRDGRLYLYASNDDDNAVEGGYSMASYVCVSTRDLKNWTDHGEVFRVPAQASWAGKAWAPTLVERNGVIFMYFGNGGADIGVASSTSPIGPFEDAKGSALVNSSTPGASGPDMWLFDPAVFIDDDGQAYLYFGGNGESNVRVIRLNEDMVSVSGSAITLTAPNFFEASWMHKRDGVYYFSYSTNPAGGLKIDYMTSSSPTGGFVHRGTIADQPPDNHSDNNHAGEFEFEGHWYHAYHNRVVATRAGIATGYRRNLAIEELFYNEDGSIREVEYTEDGLPQLESLDPYTRVEAETTNAQSGIETEPTGSGGMVVTDIDDGDWIRVCGVDFGDSGAATFSASVASAAAGGAIELRLDEPDGTLMGTCPVAATGGLQVWALSTCAVSGATGVKDLYLRFKSSGSAAFNVDYWQFTPVDGGSGGEGGAGAGGAELGGGAGEIGEPEASGGSPSAGIGGTVAGGASSSGSGGEPTSSGGSVDSTGGVTSGGGRSGGGAGGTAAASGGTGVGGARSSGGAASLGGAAASGGGPSVASGGTAAGGSPFGYASGGGSSGQLSPTGGSPSSGGSPGSGGGRAIGATLGGAAGVSEPGPGAPSTNDDAGDSGGCGCAIVPSTLLSNAGGWSLMVGLLAARLRRRRNSPTIASLFGKYW